MESDEHKIQETVCVKVLSDMKTDLRTELTPVMGFCEMLIAKNYGDLSDAQIEKLQRINQHLTNMISIISASQ